MHSPSFEFSLSVRAVSKRKKAYGHVLTFTHGRGRVTIMVHKLKNDKHFMHENNSNSNINTWSYCKVGLSPLGAGRRLLLLMLEICHVADLSDGDPTNCIVAFYVQSVSVEVLGNDVS